MLSALRSSFQIRRVLTQFDPSKRSGREHLRALRASHFLAMQQWQPSREWKVVCFFGVLLTAGALSVPLAVAVLLWAPLDSRYLPSWLLVSFGGLGAALSSTRTYLLDEATWAEFGRQFTPLTDELSLAVQAVDIIDRCPECRAYRDAVVGRRPMVYRDLEAMRFLEAEVSASEISRGALTDEQFRETIFREVRQTARGPREDGSLTLEKPCLS